MVFFSLEVSCNVHMDKAILVPVALSPALDTNLAQKQGEEESSVVHCQVQPADDRKLLSPSTMDQLMY